MAGVNNSGLFIWLEYPLAAAFENHGAGHESRKDIYAGYLRPEHCSPPLLPQNSEISKVDNLIRVCW